MKILPLVTQPWDRRIARHHTPKERRGKRAFRSYVACLRWEFGFSCAFCLCHEADFAACGAKGSGLFHVEHFSLQSAHPALRNSYGNCFYICRYCNEARRDLPTREEHGRELINSCDRAWGEVFAVRRDRFELCDHEDGNGTYTRQAYDLNDPRKVRSRWLRRTTIGRWLRFLRKAERLEDRLLDRVERGLGTVNEVDTAWGISTARRDVYEDLKRFRAVPTDCARPCLCFINPRLLPDLDVQCVEVPPRPKRHGDARKQQRRPST